MAARRCAFTAADNEEHGELWTPAVLTDDVIIEVVVPQSLHGQFRLELAAVNVGIPRVRRATW